MRKLVLLSVVVVAIGSLASTASAWIYYADESAFLASIPDHVTNDFETPSGFPDASAGPQYIGVRGGVNFEATVNAYPLAVSGTQTMSGAVDTFSSAKLDFTGMSVEPTALGFYALDLQYNEIVRATFHFQGGASLVADVMLRGTDPQYTPEYFGLSGSVGIDTVEFYGTDITAADRAWVVDNVTFVPEPSSLALLGVLAGGLLGRRRETSA